MAALEWWPGYGRASLALLPYGTSVGTLSRSRLTVPGSVLRVQGLNQEFELAESKFQSNPSVPSLTGPSRERVGGKCLLALPS